MDVKSKQELLPFFVYGTLLPGQPNAYLWGEAVAAQQTAVLPNGRLYDLGSFPMLVEEGEESVQGMLIWVRPAEYTAVVASLDELEGYDPAQPLASAYRRVRRAVQEITARHGSGSVAIVAHGGVNPLVLAALLDVPVPEAVARIRQSNDEVYLVRLRKGHGPGVWKLVGRSTLEQL